MALYSTFLTVMAWLFGSSAAVLLLMTVVQAVKGRGQRAGIYLGLTLLACGVAAGFYFFRCLI